MERRRGVGDGGTVVVVVLVGLVMVLANGVNGQKIYSCFGGCYNECFMSSSSKTGSERLACYYLCLNGCVPRSPSDFEYYCQIGCSFKLCIPFSFGTLSLSLSLIHTHTHTLREEIKN